MAQLNKVLQLLTARHTGFVSAIFQTPGGYLLPPQTVQERSLREFLHLHVENTDYYVQGALAALAAYPEVAAEVPDDPRTWEPGDFRPPLIETTDGNFVPDRTGMVGIQHHPEQLPAAFKMSLSYVNDTSGRLIVGRRRVTLNVRVITQGDYQYLYADWPEYTGIHGGIRLDETLSWEAGYEFTADFFPASYPYKWVTDTAVQREDAQDILQMSGFLEAYTMDDCPIRRMAMLVTSLILRTNRYDLDIEEPDVEVSVPNSTYTVVVDDEGTTYTVVVDG